MGTNAYTQIIRSPELKVLFDSVEKALHVPDDPESFAKSLMLASHSEETVSQIKLLSERLDFKIMENVSGEEDPGTICVFDVDVFFEKDHLQVVKRDPVRWIKTTHQKNENILKVILVHSKSLRVIETKLRVYREYEGLFRSKMLHIQHEYDDFDEIAKKSANAKAMSFQRTIQSLIQSIPYEELFSIIDEASKKAYSRENIRNICFNEFITDGENVGTVYSNSYVCRFFVTVRRIKAELVTNTLRSVGKAFASEICKGILRHIESKIQSALRHDLIRLRFDISDDIFATVTVVLLFVIASVINPLYGAAVAVISLVVTFVWSVDVNSVSWRRKVADEIFETVSKNRDDVVSKLLPMVQRTCLKTTRYLKNVSEELEEWTQNTKCMEIEEMVSLWKHREAMKNIFGIRSYPSVLNLIAGVKDNKPMLKVFLSHEDEEAKEFFRNMPGFPENVDFVVVSSKSKKTARTEGRTEYNSFRIDHNSREKISKIIKRQGERLFANHSSIVGLGIGNMGPGQIPCIIIYCLDKYLIPFGEKPIPKMLEGYLCDMREDTIRFAACFDCHEIDHPNSGCCVGISSNSFGSVGFLVKMIGSNTEALGFLTAAHVAAENWIDLYNKKCLLSQLETDVCSHEMFHQPLPNNEQRVGKVKEAFCGNWGPKEIGIDAAFVQYHKPKKAELRELRLAEESELNYNDQLIVLKRGGATGETFGRLLDGSWSPCVNPRLNDIAFQMGSFYFFESCFAVEDIYEHFFDFGDSGSGVFLTENRKPTKPLGIAFAKLDNEPITFVCRMNEVAEAFNLRVYETLDPMEVDQI